MSYVYRWVVAGGALTCLLASCAEQPSANNVDGANESRQQTVNADDEPDEDLLFQPDIDWDLSEGHTIDLIGLPVEMPSKLDVVEIAGRTVRIKISEDRVVRAAVDRLYVCYVDQKIFWVGLYFSPMTVEDGQRETERLAEIFGYRHNVRRDFARHTWTPGHLDGFERTWRSGDFPITIGAAPSFIDRSLWMFSFKLYFETADTMFDLIRGQQN